MSLTFDLIINALAIVLSGANHDGTIGSKVIQQFNGKVIAQDPAEAETPAMPEHVISEGFYSQICTTERMIDVINQFGAGGMF